MFLAPTQIREPEVNINNHLFANSNDLILQIFEVSWVYPKGRVYDAFVEDESLAYGACDDHEMLGGGVSPEEIGVDHIDVASFVERLSDVINQVLTHDVMVELPGSSYIEGESPDLAADFA